LLCEILQKNDESLTITLENVKYIPSLWVCLFRIGKSFKHGFSISNEGETINLMKDDITILFDRQITTKNSFVPGFKIMLVLSNVGLTTVETRKVDSKNKIDINNLHQILGHCGKISARLTGKALGYDVVEIVYTCEAFSIEDARQKNISKD
jgi:hypothetical protein